jgi:hypothetical protein
MVMIVTAVVVVNFGLSYSCPFCLTVVSFSLTVCTQCVLQFVLQYCAQCVFRFVFQLSLLCLQLSLLSYSCRFLSYSGAVARDRW